MTSGAELLRAVRQGRLWVIALRAYAADPEVRAITDTLYDSLSGAIRGFDPFNLSSNILISSPGAQVYYHADAAPSMLWHVRGRKRFYLYPAYDDDFVAREHLEAIFSGARGEEIPFRNEFDRAAQVFERLISTYPAGDAVLDGMLRLAECRLKLNQRDDARALYTRVITQFPGTAAATQAEQRLASLSH